MSAPVWQTDLDAVKIGQNILAYGTVRYSDDYGPSPQEPGMRRMTRDQDGELRVTEPESRYFRSFTPQMWIPIPELPRNEIVRRDDVPDDYKEMLETETHHGHLIIKDKGGVLRWQEDEFVRRLVSKSSLNEIIQGFYQNGNNKNCETYRELYRRMGVSLHCYWETFYWELNNEDADQYVQPF